MPQTQAAAAAFVWLSSSMVAQLAYGSSRPSLCRRRSSARQRARCTQTRGRLQRRVTRELRIEGALPDGRGHAALGAAVEAAGHQPPVRPDNGARGRRVR